MRSVLASIVILATSASGLHAQSNKLTQKMSPAELAVDTLNRQFGDSLLAKFGHYPPKDDQEQEHWVKVLSEDPKVMREATLEKDGQVLQLMVSRSASSPEKLAAIWLPAMRDLAKKYDLKGSGVRFLSVIPCFGPKTGEKEYVLGVILDSGEAYVLDVATKKKINLPW